ncbi:hypothetical protein ACFGW1_01680 [Pasteurella multocida]
MRKHNIAQQIVEIQEMLEVARDNVIEDHCDDAKVILQRAIVEIKKVNWRMAPVQVGK